MYSFGKIPPRLLESFGVSGLLGEGCQIFYDNLFSTRHLGRISDLLAARVQKANPDELRMRALLLYSIFEAYQSQVNQQGDCTLEAPIVIECGIDEEKIAIGVSFHMPGEEILDWNQIGQNVSDRSPGSAFEVFLAYLHAHANQVVLRAHTGSRRVEIVSLLGLQEKMDPEVLAEIRAIEVVVLPENVTEAPQAESYVQLGDLDYPALLKEDHPGRHIPASSTGEVLARASQSLDPDFKTTVKGKEDQSLADSIRARRAKTNNEGDTRIEGVTDQIEDEETHLKSSDEIEEETTRVSGKKEKSKKEKFVVEGGDEFFSDEMTSMKGDGEHENESENTSASGSESKSEDVAEFAKRSFMPLSSSSALSSSQEKLYVSKIEELQKRIAELDGKSKNTKTRVRGGSHTEGPELGLERSPSEALDHFNEELGDENLEDEFEEEEVEGAKQIRKSKRGGSGFEKIIKRFWPFKSKEKSASSQEELDEEEELESLDSASVDDNIDEVTEDKIQPSESELVERHDDGVNTLVAEIQDGSLEKTLSKAKQEAEEIKKDIKDDRAKRWMDGLVGELVAEKAKLHDLAKKLNLSIRQKEMEFRGKTQTLQQELKRSEELLRQRSNQLTRNKEQLAQAQVKIEKLKSSAISPSEDLIAKQKVVHIQKLLNVSKDENNSLYEKIEDFKNQLMAAQVKINSTGPSIADFANIQTKYERAQKQTEELKKINQQLMERLNEKKERPGTSPSNVEEMRKRVEAAMKQIANGKKDLDQMAIKVTDLQTEEARLKKELNQTQLEVKRLKTANIKAQMAAATATAAANAQVRHAGPPPKSAVPTKPSDGTGGKGSPPVAA